MIIATDVTKLRKLDIACDIQSIYIYIYIYSYTKCRKVVENETYIIFASRKRVLMHTEVTASSVGCETKWNICLVFLFPSENYAAIRLRRCLRIDLLLRAYVKVDIVFYIYIYTCTVSPESRKLFWHFCDSPRLSSTCCLILLAHADTHRRGLPDKKPVKTRLKSTRYLAYSWFFRFIAPLSSDPEVKMEFSSTVYKIYASTCSLN